MHRVYLILLVVTTSVGLWGCADEAQSPADAGVGVDAAAADSGDRDLGQSADSGSEDLLDSGVDSGDSGIDEPTEPRPQRVTATLTDGTFATGEIVAVYDRTRWWNPDGGGLIYALFDPERHANGDADRAFTFVLSDDVSELIAIEPVEQSYREFLAERGLEFDRTPFADAAYVVMGNDGYHLDEDGFGDFAFDLQLTDDQGRRFSGNGTQNTDHFVWDAPAVAPIGGIVFEIVESGVDNPPGTYPEGATNNLVGIRLGGNFYAYLLHFRQDGVDDTLEVGDRIEPGDPLGRVGNSGVTLEPHLHLALLWYDPSRGRSFSVPAAFRTVEVSPGPIGPWTSKDSFVPDSGVWIR